MKRKMASAVTLTLLLASMLTLAFNIQPVKAEGTIYIRADGSIDPPTAPIQRDGDIYTIVDNINDSIVVERDNIVVDGASRTLQGSGYGNGIAFSGRSNITIKNMQIMDFGIGIYLYLSSRNTISGNNIRANRDCGIYLRYSSNTTISGNNITDNGVGLGVHYGILLSQGSNDNTISGNNIRRTSGTGGWSISLEYASNNNAIAGNNITNNSCGISLLIRSCYNTISGNNITATAYWGVHLDEASSYNTISKNNVTNNYYGIGLLRSSNNNCIHHNNFINNAPKVYIADSINQWDDGYPSGGNYWSDYVGVDVRSGPGQDLPGSDGLGDTPYVIDAGNRDRYPLMNPYGAPPSPTYSLTITTTVGGTTDPVSGIYGYTANSTVQVAAIPEANYLLSHWELDSVNVGSANPYTVLMDEDHTLNGVFSPVIHDIVVTDVSPSKTIVGQGFSVKINVTVENRGDLTETFNVTLYANDTFIASQPITLTSGNSTTLTFTWNTTGFAKGNYTIWAYAWPVPGETYLDDNTFFDGWVLVTIPGDVNGDRKVDGKDVALTIKHYGSYPSHPKWNPNADVNCDGKVDGKDIALVIKNYGKTDP
jgi:parallel beta-helix repeat protein